MKTITLGKTGITTPQNAFGALPIQRVDMQTAIHILRKAYEGLSLIHISMCIRDRYAGAECNAVYCIRTAW